ncbi:hypothetical protein [Bosea minatitlanensis]|uniref:Uncharacterized protein n=1 Tax=Bosea minatitlanensis TaxID=128782 RepID=A0ABW0F783_9HYPH|nr:hypothetical protein [Bosea minatitlanensis]
MAFVPARGQVSAMPQPERAGLCGENYSPQGRFFKRTIRLTDRTIRVDWACFRFAGSRGDLSEQLAPRHQTLKRHDWVVGSIIEETDMAAAIIFRNQPRFRSPLCRCRR